MIMSHGYNTVACGATGVPGTVAGNGVYPASYGGHHATTAHQSMAQQQHQHLHMQQDMHQLQHKQIEHPVKSSSPSMHSGSDPFSPGCGFGAEDEFDIPALPAASMDDPPPHPHQAHYYGGEAQMMASQQNAMYHHHPMYAAAYGQHQHYGGQYDQYAYGYGSSGQMYHSGGAHQAQASSGCVMPGGPSPGGSHNTPSPQAHSEDGDVGEHIRNNNVLKTADVVGYGPGVSAHHVAVAHQHHVHHVVQKKPKVSKRKKKRDPNEPQKPVSAYALFFRDSQAAIKVRNPNAAFGDVSKIVASLWDALDPDNKAAYKKRTETAKKEYLKKLAAYRATLVSMGNLDGSNPYAPYASSYSAYADIATMKAGGYMATAAGSMGQPIPPRPPMQQHGQQQQGMQQQQGSPHMATGGVGYMMQHQQHNSQVRKFARKNCDRTVFKTSCFVYF
jgi:hypothetical protein